MNAALPVVKLAAFCPGGRRMFALAFGILSASAPVLGQDVGSQQSSNPAAAKDVVTVRPESDLLSKETRALLSRRKADNAELDKLCPAAVTTAAQSLELRRCYDANFYRPLARLLRSRFAVSIKATTIAGVPVETIEPAGPIPRANAARVLINLHGGSFLYGGGAGGQLESIPVAATARIKVVSVDYRMAPEYRFPAASEDVVKVYRSLLKDHRPETIGIYGCSAGAMITASALAMFQREGLPMPGAVAMLCGAALRPSAGDSGARTPNGSASKRTESDFAYFRTEDLDDPLAFPGHTPAILSRFPPTLLVTSGRDFAMSSVIATHAELVRLKVPAELHVFEGLDHGAYVLTPDLPEARQAVEVVANFFTRRLAR